MGRTSSARRAAGWVAAAAAVALLTNPAVAVAAPARVAPDPPTSCAVDPLPEAPDWDMSIVTGADPTGRFVAGRGYPEDVSDYERYTVLWDNGKRQLVPIPGLDQSIQDVNSSGTAVGESYDPATYELMTPWVIADGKATALPGVASGRAVAINERGDIAGTADGEALVWKAHSTGPQKLERPQGSVSAEAAAIDEDGTVVGSYTLPGRDQRQAAVWTPDGRLWELTFPTGPSTYTAASNIRNGWVTGLTWTPNGRLRVRWNLADGTATTFPQLAYINAVNSSGWLVGARGGDFLAMLTTEAGDMVLPGLVKPDADTHVAGVSDDGRTLAGYAGDDEGELHALVWQCK